MNTPPLSKITAQARRQGLTVRRSSGTGLLWLVAEGDRLASPRRGLTEDELWTLVSLPEADPRAQAVWNSTPEQRSADPATLDEWEFGPEPPQ